MSADSQDRARRNSLGSFFMELKIPALNLKTKLVALMVALLAVTLGSAVMVSLTTQSAIAGATEENFKELASAIQISVQELTAVGNTDRDRLQNYVRSIHNKGIEVSIASSENLIINRAPRQDHAER